MTADGPLTMEQWNQNELEIPSVHLLNRQAPQKNSWFVAVAWAGVAVFCATTAVAVAMTAVYSVLTRSCSAPCWPDRSASWPCKLRLPNARSDSSLQQPTLGHQQRHRENPTKMIEEWYQWVKKWDVMCSKCITFTSTAWQFLTFCTVWTVYLFIYT